MKSLLSTQGFKLASLTGDTNGWQDQGFNDLIKQNKMIN